MQEDQKSKVISKLHSRFQSPTSGEVGKGKEEKKQYFTIESVLSSKYFNN